MVVCFVIILMLYLLIVFLLHQRILSDLNLLLVLHLSIIYILTPQIILLLLMISYFLLNLHSYNMHTRLQNHNIFLGILLILRNVVGRMLSSPLRTLLRNVLSPFIRYMLILLFSLFNSRTLRITQILPPLIAHSGSEPPQSMSLCPCALLPLVISLLTQWIGL